MSGKKQHDKQHCGTGKCPRCCERNENAVPFLFTGLAPGWTLTVTDSDSHLWFQTTLARGSEVTGRLPICEILTFQLDRTGSRSTTGKFSAAQGLSLRLGKFTGAGSRLRTVSGGQRSGKTAAFEALHGPTGETADALRREGCVWGGVTDKGTHYWEHEDCGPVARRCDANWETNNPGATPFSGRPHVVSPKENIESYRSRGLLTRGEPEPKHKWESGNDEGECRHCGEGSQHAGHSQCKGCGAAVSPLCTGFCTRECRDANKTPEGAGEEAMGAIKDTPAVAAGKSLVKPMADGSKAIEGMEKLSKVLDDIGYQMGRKNAWGDMRTERESNGGPILICGEPGHVRLYLERLSDDREKAMGQLEDAVQECGDAPGPVFLMRINALVVALQAAKEAINVGWKLPPYLQAIRDAHAAIGIARDWDSTEVAAGKIRAVQAEHRTRMGPEVQPVRVEGQAGPGWPRR